MRVRILKEESENGKLVLLLRVEIEMNSLHKRELGELERQMLDLILEKGEVTQKELSQIFGQVKACRTIKKLENMGIVRRERKGRTYVIRVV